MVRVLITGCAGMLGRAVYEEFVQEHEVLATDIVLNEAWLKELDVRDYNACRHVFESFKPDVVLHLAALTNLEYCEQHPDDAYKTNVLGTENISLLSQEHDAVLIYVSTAGVFGGEKETYTEYDEPNPLSVYAHAKLQGELFVQRHVQKYFVVRAGWMFGGLRKDKKFVKMIFDQIKNEQKELFVVRNLSGTPTYTKDFAKGLLALLETTQYGLYHQVCEGLCTRREIAQEIVSILGLDEVVVTPVSSEYFSKEFFVQRPASEQLINFKLTARGLNNMRSWKTCLHEYVKELEQQRS